MYFPYIARWGERHHVRHLTVAPSPSLQGIARVGTLIGYDDFWTIPCDKYKNGGMRRAEVLGNPLDVGEGLAHLELTRRHGVRFECVGGPCKVSPTLISCHKHNGWAPIFLVTAIGARSPDPGFNFSSAMRDMMQMHKTCRQFVG